ncbi:unnamed protein product [Discosporangium mesarthrocarpum]
MGGGSHLASPWVYMSKAWVLKWASGAYPGPVSNHHVTCQHGRVKPNVGLKRAINEVVAVPEEVHRSLVNHYGPRTPHNLVVPPLNPILGSGGIAAAAAAAVAAAAASSGGNGATGDGRRKNSLYKRSVGFSRPLLELSSCRLCAAIGEELSKARAEEQKEVARLSLEGREMRKRNMRSRELQLRAAEEEGKAESWGSKKDAGNGLDGSVFKEGPGERVGDGDGEGSHPRQKSDTSTSEGDVGPWYLVAATWLSRWQAYVLAGADEDLDFPTPPPGPITNGDLVDAEGVPVENKEGVTHYRGAAKGVWEFLLATYGGGPPLRRVDPNGLYDDPI